MTGIDELEDGTDMVRHDGRDRYDPDGVYSITRLRVQEIFGQATNDEMVAFELTTRLEKAIKAAALLYSPDADKARKAFMVGFEVFCQDLD